LTKPIALCLAFAQQVSTVEIEAAICNIGRAFEGCLNAPEPERIGVPRSCLVLSLFAHQASHDNSLPSRFFEVQVPSEQLQQLHVRPAFAFPGSGSLGSMILGLEVLGMYLTEDLNLNDAVS